MFPGMLLHMKEPPVPVEFPVHHTSRLQVFSADMQDIIFFIPHIRHFPILQIPLICGLSSAFRKKSGFIQNDFISVLSFLAA